MKDATLSLLAALLLASTAVVGCTTSPGFHPGQESRVDSLQAIASNLMSVRLIWFPPDHEHFNPTPYSYQVTWEPAEGDVTEPGDTGTAVVGSVDVAENSYTITIEQLQARMYTFSVRVMYAEDDRLHFADEVEVVEGAPAEQYLMDFTLNEPLRMYEPASGKGSGLMLTDVVASPTRVASTDADPGSLIVTMRVEGSPPNEVVLITPANLVPEYMASGVSHPHIYLMGFDVGAGSTPYHQTVPSFLPLDEWSISAEDFLDLVHWPGELSIPAQDVAYGPGHPYNFILHLGELEGPRSTRRYMRVSVVAEPDGMILRGDAPDRFIELKISFGFPGVPFA